MDVLNGYHFVIAVLGLAMSFAAGNWTMYTAVRKGFVPMATYAEDKERHSQSLKELRQSIKEYEAEKDRQFLEMRQDQEKRCELKHAACGAPLLVRLQGMEKQLTEQGKMLHEVHTAVTVMASREEERKGIKA